MTSENTKYFLGTLNNTLIGDHFEISIDDYNSYKNVITDFSELIQDESLFKVVELNYEDFKSKIAYYSLNFTEFQQADFYAINPISFDINRLFLNLLSTIRTFLDHKSTMLKRKFGDTSEEFALFEQERKAAFENNFEYRFISKLRNYAQHCGLPIENPEMKSYLNENSEPQKEFNLYFEKAKLLSKFEWGAVVKKDLESQPNRLDVLIIIDKVYCLLNNLNEKLNNRILENYKKEGTVLLDLISKTIGLVGMPCIMKREGTETLTFSINWFPISHIAKITGTDINIVYN